MKPLFRRIFIGSIVYLSIELLTFHLLRIKNKELFFFIWTSLPGWFLLQNLFYGQRLGQINTCTKAVYDYLSAGGDPCSTMNKGNICKPSWYRDPLNIILFVVISINIFLYTRFAL